jgi:hypothetical protein
VSFSSPEICSPTLKHVVTLLDWYKNPRYGEADLYSIQGYFKSPYLLLCMVRNGHYNIAKLLIEQAYMVVKFRVSCEPA